MSNASGWLLLLLFVPLAMLAYILYALFCSTRELMSAIRLGDLIRHLLRWQFGQMNGRRAPVEPGICPGATDGDGAVAIARRIATEEGWPCASGIARVRYRRPLLGAGGWWVVDLNPGREGNSARLVLDGKTTEVLEKSYLMGRDEALVLARRVAAEVVAEAGYPWRDFTGDPETIRLLRPLWGTGGAWHYETGSGDRNGDHLRIAIDAETGSAAGEYQAGGVR